jgi:phage/plasmid primase-like uncharacterized protein
MRNDLIERAVGCWHDILLLNGVPGHFLTGKNGPCPFCGGKDRFRFSNKNGSGGFICSQCGHGYGVHLLMRFHNVSMHEALKMVENVIGHARRRSYRPQPTGDKLKENVGRTWKTGSAPDVSILTADNPRSALSGAAGNPPSGPYL